MGESGDHCQSGVDQFDIEGNNRAILFVEGLVVTISSANCVIYMYILCNHRDVIIVVLAYLHYRHSLDFYHQARVLAL